MNSTDLAQVMREVAWFGALRHWYVHGGDMTEIATLLSENAPMTDNEAQFLSAILSGLVKPRASMGGSMAKLEEDHVRNGLINIHYEQVHQEKKSLKASRPGLRMMPSAEAQESVAAVFGVSDATVKNADTPKVKNAWRLRLAGEEAKFLALYRRDWRTPKKEKKQGGVF